MAGDADLFADLAPPVPAGHAKDGLASDYWWTDCTLATANSCRAWVRCLLEDQHISDHDIDRFIASLSPGKREDLIRRAVNGWGTSNF
jgi:hypothetical protein